MVAENNVKSLERALYILDCFINSTGELSVHELHQMTGIPKSTIMRLLGTLAHYHYIRQDPVSDNYLLGSKVLTLGGIFQKQIDVRKEALPFMKNLSKELGETVDLNIVDRGERVCIEVVETNQNIRHFVRVGQRSELYRGSTGKVLLAFLPEVEQETVITKASLENIDVQTLRVELERIRQNGYAITRGERVPGSFAVSAPIFNHEGSMISCLTISGPIQRLTEDRVPQIVAQIVVSSREISRIMGYMPTVKRETLDEKTDQTDNGESSLTF